MRANNVWIVGNRVDAEVVRRSGKDFFFQARIEAHHDEVRAMLRRIVGAELIYSTQHNGQFGDLPTLITAGLLPPTSKRAIQPGIVFALQSARTHVVSAPLPNLCVTIAPANSHSMPLVGDARTRHRRQAASLVVWEKQNVHNRTVSSMQKILAEDAESRKIAHDISSYDDK